MKHLLFYRIPLDYVNYLRKFETSIRGFSPIPFVDYQVQNRREKFFCGIVMQINDHQYYVPVSSKVIDKPHTFYLYGEGKRRRIAALRFDYMFPVPENLIQEFSIDAEPDRQYRGLLKKELRACRQNEGVIRECALHTYLEVLAPVREHQHNNREHSCNFRLLEGACDIYRQEHGLTAESLEPSVAMLRNQQPRTLDEIIASATAKAERINRQTDPVLPQKEKAITHD